MVTDLSHQSRRALPRDLVAGKVAVHEDCDLVHMFLSSISQRCFGFPNQISCCTFQRGKVEFTRLAHSLGQRFRLFQPNPICLVPGQKVSHKQICIVLLHLFSESDSVFRLTPTCLVVSLVGFSVRVASRFTDDEWCVSQVKFNVQVLSSLINPNSKHTVQQQKLLHVRIFESKCSHVFRCVFGLEKTVDVFESIIV